MKIIQTIKAFFNDPERPWWNLWMPTDPDDWSM